MKNYLCLILLIHIIACYGQDKKLQVTENLEVINQTNEPFVSNETKEVGFQSKNDDQRNGYLKKRNDEFHYYANDDEEYIGNPDFDAKIERPCRVFDLNCIRKFFAEHSKCKIRRGPLPRSFFISQESLFFSRVNMTATPTNFMVGSFRNSRIEEFYINRRTNKIVISINIRGFNTRSPSIYLQFYRSGREPIVIVTEGGQIYPSVTFTGIIPNIENLQLDKVELTAYADSVPVFALGPELANNTDPTVTQSLVEFLADTATNTEESFLTDAQFYLPAYIQFNICDFGLTNL